MFMSGIVARTSVVYMVKLSNIDLGGIRFSDPTELGVVAMIGKFPDKTRRNLGHSPIHNHP